jgi:hypothetical protein
VCVCDMTGARTQTHTRSEEEEEKKEEKRRHVVVFFLLPLRPPSACVVSRGRGARYFLVVVVQRGAGALFSSLVARSGLCRVIVIVIDTAEGGAEPNAKQRGGAKRKLLKKEGRTDKARTSEEPRRERKNWFACVALSLRRFFGLSSFFVCWSRVVVVVVVSLVFFAASSSSSSFRVAFLSLVAATGTAAALVAAPLSRSMFSPPPPEPPYRNLLPFKMWCCSSRPSSS